MVVEGCGFIFELIFMVLSTSVCSVKCHKFFRAHVGEGLLRLEDGEAARMGESNSPKLSKAVLGCHNKKAQGTFSWVPPWVRSSVASHMAELTLPSGEWRSSTLVFLMTNIL